MKNNKQSFKNWKHIEIIIREMCRRVGADFDSLVFTKTHEDMDVKEAWFMKHEWSEDEQDDFKKWLVEYLLNNAEARREIMKSSDKNMKKLEAAAGWFIFAFGWKTKGN